MFLNNFHKEGIAYKLLDASRAINARFQIEREIRAGYAMLDLREAISSMSVAQMYYSGQQLVEIIQEGGVSNGDQITTSPGGGGTWNIITSEPTFTGGTVGDGGYLNTNEGLGWSEGEYGGFGTASEELQAWYEINGGP